MASDAASPFVAQGFVHIGSRQIERGYNPEDQFYKDGNSYRKKKYPDIGFDGNALRQIPRSPDRERPGGHKSQLYAERSGDQRKHHAFNEQLAHQQTTPGSQSRAHCHFSSASERSGEQEAGHIRASNQ